MFRVTDVAAHLHLDVTSLSPGCGPGVTDQPVTFVHVITDIDDGMVIRVFGAA